MRGLLVGLAPGGAVLRVCARLTVCGARPAIAVPTCWPMLWASDDEEKPPLPPPPPMDVPGLLPPAAGVAGEAAAGGEAAGAGELAVPLAMAYPPPAARTAMRAVTSAVRAWKRGVPARRGGGGGAGRPRSLAELLRSVMTQARNSRLKNR